MAFDLARLDLTGMLRCGLHLRQATGGTATMEAAARQVCRVLYDEFRDPVSGARQCALVRFYKSHPFGALPADVASFAERLMPAGVSATAELRCLTLLGTAGDEAGWNDRRASRGHQAIPLPSPRLVEQAPMVAQLLRQFGLDVAHVVNPSTSMLPELIGRTYGIFHVEHASGSPFIPAQQEFVARYAIQSVVGFGGALRTGDLFATVLFSRVPVPRDAAERFRTIALDVKGVLFRLDDGRVFDQG